MSDLTLDLEFAPMGTDSPKDLTVALPPGLLANASINGGKCLTSTTAMAACQVGSGTVTASPIVLGIPVGSISIAISQYLVAPPSPADLAGVLTVANPGTPAAMDLGSLADVTVRPSGDPAGVGLTQHFANLPDTFPVAGVANAPIFGHRAQERLHRATPAGHLSLLRGNILVSADSYADPSSRSASAPLKVTGCSALPFAPKFSVSATRDIADSGVQVVTDVTQKANEAPSRNVSLTLPPHGARPQRRGGDQQRAPVHRSQLRHLQGDRHRELHLTAVPQAAHRTGLPHRIADRAGDHDPLPGAVRAHPRRSGDPGDRTTTAEARTAPGRPRRGGPR